LHPGKLELEAQMVPQHVNAFPDNAARPPLDFAPVALVADDDRVVRELCREVLETEALRVLTASNGQEALAIAEAWVPDVLVTDVTMPGLDGFGLVRALRRLYPEIPVIVITGEEEYDGRAVQAVASDHGVLATLMKPFDVAALGAVVRSAVPYLGPRPLRSEMDVHAA
jgi:CheY-like chemotaxis protein